MKTSDQAFSLVEILLALGVFAFCIIGLLGILGGSLNLAGEVQSDYRVHLIAENLQSRFLLEPGWPNLSANQPLELTLDADGLETDSPSAVFRVLLKKTTLPNWESSFLQTLVAEVKNAQGQPIETIVLSRAISPVAP